MTIHLELLKDLNFNQNFKGLLLVGFLKGKAGAGGYDDHDRSILSVWMNTMMTLVIDLISLQSASGPGRAKGPTSQLPLSSLQEQGIFRFTPVVNYNLIWVSFCRTGNLAVSRHIFSKSKAFVWPNLKRYLWFVNCSWLIVSCRSWKHLRFT